MKFFTTLLISLFIASVSYGQYVSDKKVAFVVKQTATWCGPCGTWGWDLWSDVLTDNTLPEFGAAQVHSSTASELTCPAAVEVAAFYEASTGVPSFYVGPVNQTQSSGGGINVSGTLARIKAVIRAYDRLDAKVGVGYSATLNNDVIDISAKVKAFSDVSTEHYLAVYVLEKDVVNYQNGQGNDAVHKIVLRDALTPNGYGNLIKAGSISAGEEFDYTFSYTVPANMNAENVRLAMVIWEKDGSEWKQESSYSVRESLVSSTEQPFEEKATLEVFATADAINYSIAPKQAGDLKVDLVNVSGQIVQPLFFGSVDQQLQRSFPVSNPPSGVYFVRSNFEGTVKTEAVKF